MNKDDEIRSIAFRLWEEEGKPEGRQLEHWQRAEAIWHEQNNQNAAGDPPPTEKPVRRKRNAPRSPRKTRKAP